MKLYPSAYILLKAIFTANPADKTNIALIAIDDLGYAETSY